MPQKYYGYTQAQVLAHLQSQYQDGKDFVDTKRELFRERIKDYTNVTSDKDKIYVRLLFTVIQTLLSLRYSDEMSVSFVGRQLGADEVAQQLENLAEFDYEEMGMDDIMYQIDFDSLFYGTGFLVYDHWNSTKQCPKYRRVSPMAVIPDPTPDDMTGARYYQFELEVDLAYLTKERGFMNVSKLQRDINDELEENKQAFTTNRELQYIGPYASNTQNVKVPIHYCYTMLGGEKYFVVTALTHGVVLKMQKLEQIMKEEKGNPEEVRYPVIEFPYIKYEGDPFNISVPDILADKQRGMQLILNLEKTKAMFAAFGNKYLFNSNMVNSKDLQSNSVNTKYIPVKGGDLAQAVYEIPVSRVDGDVLQLSDRLQQQATLDIGIDERSLGAMGDRNITATENQRIQKNANLKQALGTKLKIKSLKLFWMDWYKRYYQNFKWNSEKNILLNSKFGTIPITVKRKDIITGYDIDLAIESKSEQEAKREQMKLEHMANTQLILQNPTTAKIAKTLWMRKGLLLSGYTVEEARMYVTPSYEEMQALQDLELINRNESPVIGDINEDHMTYIMIYQRAINTPAKRKAIEARKMLYMKSGQSMQQMTIEGGGQQAMVTNQMVNQRLQEQPQQQASSLQDVAQ